MKILNAVKRSSIVEQLANNKNCAKTFYLDRFKKI